MFSLHTFKYSWTSGSSPGELEVAALMDFFPLRHRVLLTVPVPEPLASDLAEPLWQRTFPGRLLARLPDGTRYGPIPARLRATIPSGPARERGERASSVPRQRDNPANGYADVVPTGAAGGVWPQCAPQASAAGQPTPGREPPGSSLPGSRAWWSQSSAEGLFPRLASTAPRVPGIASARIGLPAMTAAKRFAARGRCYVSRSPG